ncbi:CinA family protein [Halothiobacillus sp. DCM-1]|uniref:CinA family protein n=1 Tax=Halothiobacillus sp. DCM-1 TaxID=3112558 RepID=UPI00324D669D
MSGTPGDLIERATRLGQALQAGGWRITTAESCTGGSLAAALTEVPGSSGWFDYGFVTYSNAAKTDLLGVPPVIFATDGAVSAACVTAMTLGAMTRAKAHLAVAISGIAGPGGGTPDKPVGTVWLAFRWRASLSVAPLAAEVEVQRLQLPGDRAAVRAQAVQQALDFPLHWLNRNE